MGLLCPLTGGLTHGVSAMGLRPLMEDVTAVVLRPLTPTSPSRSPLPSTLPFFPSLLPAIPSPSGGRPRGSPRPARGRAPGSGSPAGPGSAPELPALQLPACPEPGLGRRGAGRAGR